jgi:NDP-sugar pyrophosphorylase family protein
MKAIILAGGKGTRLAPYTTVFPKPMLPIGNKPILEIIIRQLVHYGFKDIVICTGYLGELIQAYFKNNKSLPKEINISYVYEDKPLGTAGPIALVADLKETVLIMNGDVLTTLDYKKLLVFHKNKNHLLTIAINKKEVKMDLGIIELDGDNRVVDYIEKPTYTFNDSMGIYVCEPEIIKYLNPGEYLDFPTLVKKLINDKKKVCGYYSDSSYYWIDMGRHGDYQKANEDFEKRRKEFLPNEDFII